MRTDAQSRIMSLSFKREPQEHAEIMLEAGRRFMTAPQTIEPWRIFAGAIALGAVFGLVMEGYRVFILTPLLGIKDVAPLSVICLQLAPILLIAAGLLFGWARHVRQRRRRLLLARFDHDMFADVDIFKDGIRTSAGPLMVALAWDGIRHITVAFGRIEFEADTFVAYVPERAFTDHQAFQAAARQIRQLWLDARLAIKDDQTSNPRP
jgi:hypothetical protein